VINLSFIVKKATGYYGGLGKNDTLNKEKREFVDAGGVVAGKKAGLKVPGLSKNSGLPGRQKERRRRVQKGLSRFGGNLGEKRGELAKNAFGRKEIETSATGGHAIPYIWKRENTSKNSSNKHGEGRGKRSISWTKGTPQH